MQSILTTENVPPRRRAEYWEEMVSQEFVPARCVPAARSLFDARIRSLDLDALTLCDVRSHGTDVLRTPGHISKADTPYFLVSLQMEGIGQLVQAGRSVILHPGDMALYDTSRAYELHFGGAQRQLVLRIPRADLIARGPNVESLVGIGIPNAAPAARLAADMTRNLAALDSLPSPRARHSLASTLIDLVLDGLLALDGGQSTQTGSARLADAQRIALKHLADPAFSVAKWAHTMGISERYLRLLFAPSSRSPAQYLWGQRLDRAASELRAPGSRGRSITDIALGCGFNDSAHFSHAFRAAYGMSPRDYRASN
jgi:AraC-like DNA-binding protein